MKLVVNNKVLTRKLFPTVTSKEVESLSKHDLLMRECRKDIGNFVELAYLIGAAKLGEDTVSKLFFDVATEYINDFGTGYEKTKWAEFLSRPMSAKAKFYGSPKIIVDQRF